MPKPRSNPKLARVLDKLHSAHQAGRITQQVVANIEHWMTHSHFAEYWPAIEAHVREEQWENLQDVFWTTIPFGTAGRRGRMYPIGCNAINDRTIGETVQALAEYVREVYDGPEPPTCAIAYDTRHRSDQFAKLCAEIMLAHGFHVLFFEGFRSTPLLATTVLYKKCACGVMVSASHNPPTDNAVKVFWYTGGQLREPHDAEVTRRMDSVGQLKREPFQTAVVEERVRYVAAEMDAIYRDAVLGEGFGLAQGTRDLNIIYSPLHGVGLTSVLPVLQADGFQSIEVFEPHREPNGCFPNVPNNIANPEAPAVFDAIIESARARSADIILASDPDADRLGCAAPLQLNGDEWLPLTGNQIAVLLTDYVLRKRRDAGSLTPEHFIVKTLVTTEMMRAIADSYGITTYGECLTGFKWIGSLIDEHGPAKFVLGAEEAHGYLIGTHTRDKDGAVAAMLLSELAAEAKSAGRSLHEELDLLYAAHGYFAERTIAKTLPGSDGMTKMKSMMKELREDPPPSIAGMTVRVVRDYLRGIHVDANAPRGNVIILELDTAGNYIAVRPSGTEPKIKFYLFTQVPPEDCQDLSVAKSEMQSRLDAMQSNLLA